MRTPGDTPPAGRATGVARGVREETRPGDGPAPQAGDPGRFRGALLVVAILLLAANLRAALTSVAPLIGEIRAETGISNAVAGLLTALPLLAFGLLSAAAPRLARRFGTERALFASLLLLGAGILVRSAGGVALLFAGTAVLGAAIAAGNVLLPSLVKRDYPGRTGLMTSAYSTTMGVVATVAAGISFPVAQLAGFGWRGSLALWTVPALLAAVVWIPYLRARRPAGAAGSAVGRISLWRSPLAWQVTLFMGLQSLVYYVTLTWLPEILQEGGMSAARAGWLLALSQAVALPTMFLAPVVAGRRPSQRGIVAAAVGLNAAGVLGLLLSADAAAALWVVLLGLGQGACFSIALTLFALRAPDPGRAAALSGMAQSAGYLLAAGGPSLFGFLRDATDAWTVPLGLLLAVLTALLVTGLGAARDAHVAADPAGAD